MYGLGSLAVCCCQLPRVLENRWVGVQQSTDSWHGIPFRTFNPKKNPHRSMETQNRSVDKMRLAELLYNSAYYNIFPTDSVVCITSTPPPPHRSPPQMRRKIERSGNNKITSIYLNLCDWRDPKETTCERDSGWWNRGDYVNATRFPLTALWMLKSGWPLDDW